MTRRVVGAAFVITLAIAAACARKPPAPVTPGVDRYPDYAIPLVPADLRNSATPLVGPHETAWRTLQSGDLRAAQRGFAAVLSKRADFYPSEVGLGYVELAGGNARRALEHFDRAMATAPQYVPALIGRGQALLDANRPDDALATFESALALDPSRAEVRSRVEALRFRSVERAVADARAAENAGQLEKARDAYAQAVAASPESAFLHRDLGRVERRLGRMDEALLHVQKAVALDPGDVNALLLLADLYEGKGQLKDAIAVLEKAKAFDAGAEVETRLAVLRSRAALDALPDEYRAIPETDRLTRGELAALVGVRFEPLLKDVRRAQSALVTDIRTHWAQQWILAVVRARVMEVFENHTFQPRNVVRRGDLARTVSGLLTLIAQRDPSLASLWRGARRSFRDLGPGNLYYPAASLAVASGVLDLVDGDAFQAGRVVSGAEAVDALNRLEKLAARARAAAQ